MDSRKRNSCCNVKKYSYFGTPVQLSYSGEENYKTMFGFVCTIIMMVAVLAAVVIYSIEFLRNDKPSIMYSKQRTVTYLDEDIMGQKMYPFLLVNTGKTYMNFSRAHEVFQFAINKTRSAVKVEASGLIGRTIESEEPISLIPCRSAAFVNDPEIKKYISEGSLQLIKDFGLCPVTTDIKISGGLGDAMTEQLIIQVNPCLGCLAAGETAREALANWSRVTVGIIESEYDLANKEDPIIRRFTEQSFSSLEAVKKKTMEIFLKKSTLETTTGVLIPSTQEATILSVGSVFRDDRVRYNITEPYIDIALKASNEVEVYSRSYMSLWDLAGVLGGIAGTITFIIPLIHDLYNEFSRDKHMMRSTVLRGREYESMPSKYRIQNYLKAQTLNKLGIKSSSSAIQREKETLEMFVESQEERLSVENMMKMYDSVKVLDNLFLDESHQTLLPILLMNQHLKESQVKEGKKEAQNFDEAYKEIKNRFEANKYQKEISREIDRLFLKEIQPEDVDLKSEEMQIVPTKDTEKSKLDPTRTEAITKVNVKRSDMQKDHLKDI
jgi:predicted RNase H-like HicB family nuclease